MKKRSLFVISTILLMSILTSLLCCLPVSATTVTEISDAAGLAAIANDLAGNYKLTADIDLGGADWTPIGYDDSDPDDNIADSHPFTGTFDGNGKTISNFTITADAEYGKPDAGLFGYVTTGTVKNVKISNATIFTSYSARVGAVVGHLFTATGETGGLISGCVTDSSVMVKANSIDHCADLKLGGIVGYAMGTVQYCENNATVINEQSRNQNAVNGTNKAYTGGIAGGANGTIKYCINNGNITTADYDYKKSGFYTFSAGVVGEINPWAQLVATVEGCINNGTVTHTEEELGTYVGAGGIVGNTFGGNGAITARIIKNCYNFGAVDCEYAGQIVGYMGNSDQLGTFTTQGNYGIASLAPMCDNYDKPIVGTADTAENMKATAGYAAILEAMEQNMVFELSAMPAPAVPTEKPDIPADTEAEDTDDNIDTQETDSDVVEQTTAPVESDTDTEDEGGCGGSISGISALAVVCVIGTTVTVCRRRK